MTDAARVRCGVPFVDVNSPDAARRAFALVRRLGATLKTNVMDLFGKVMFAFWAFMFVVMLATLFVQFMHLIWCEIRTYLGKSV